MVFLCAWGLLGCSGMLPAGVVFKLKARQGCDHCDVGFRI